MDATKMYRLSSQSYGGWTFDSVGRASGTGASTVDAPAPPLNGPPSAVYLPYGQGKIRGYNGKTIPYGNQPAIGQMRTANQSVKWTAAIVPPS